MCSKKVVWPEVLCLRPGIVDIVEHSRHLHAHADECKKDAKETSLEMTHVSIVNITFNIIQLIFVFTINVNESSFSWFYGVIDHGDL